MPDWRVGMAHPHGTREPKGGRDRDRAKRALLSPSTTTRSQANGQTQGRMGVSPAFPLIPLSPSLLSRTTHDTRERKCKQMNGLRARRRGRRRARRQAGRGVQASPFPAHGSLMRVEEVTPPSLTATFPGLKCGYTRYCPGRLRGAWMASDAALGSRMPQDASDEVRVLMEGDLTNWS